MKRQLGDIEDERVLPLDFRLDLQLRSVCNNRLYHELELTAILSGRGTIHLVTLLFAFLRQRRTAARYANREPLQTNQIHVVALRNDGVVIGFRSELAYINQWLRIGPVLMPYRKPFADHLRLRI